MNKIEWEKFYGIYIIDPLEDTKRIIIHTYITIIITLIVITVFTNYISKDKNALRGIKLNEPSVDLGIVCVCASSFKNIPIPKDTVIMGEVGLTGEVRRINMIEKRLKEAEKLGFKRCIIPENNKKYLEENFKMEIVGVKNIGEALRILKIK